MVAEKEVGDKPIEEFNETSSAVSGYDYKFYELLGERAGQEPSEEHFSIQIAAFRDRQQAKEFVQELKEKTRVPLRIDRNGKLSCVRWGTFTTGEAAISSVPSSPTSSRGTASWSRCRGFRVRPEFLWIEEVRASSFHIVGARPPVHQLAPVVRAFRELGIPYAVLHNRAYIRLRHVGPPLHVLGLEDPQFHLGIGSDSHARQTARMLGASKRFCSGNAPPLSSYTATPIPPWLGHWLP